MIKIEDEKDGASAINEIVQLARRASEPFDHPQGGKAVMRPDGIVQHLPPLDPPLSHVKQSVVAYDAKAFIDYVNRFKLAVTVEGQERPLPKTSIFANPQSAKLKGIVDYHTSFYPDRCSHIITFDVPASEQWSRWRAIDGKGMGQLQFAEFIEENCQDIVDPTAATFLDLVTGLQAKKKINFESGVRLQDGSNQLTYAEEVEAKGRGTMLVPAEFSIGVPIFLNGDAYKVRCLLRYRIEDGAVAFIVKIHRRQFLEYTAFSDICAAIATGTDLPVLHAWA